MDLYTLRPYRCMPHPCALLSGATRSEPSVMKKKVDTYTADQRLGMRHEDNDREKDRKIMDDELTVPADVKCVLHKPQRAFRREDDAESSITGISVDTCEHSC